MMNFYLLQVKRNIEDAKTSTGKLKKGFAAIKFLDTDQEEIYDLRGIATFRQFQNWAKREFGYLRYETISW